ncbi:hypothetical protein JOQ06_026088, partial [Pogonophryne albipinna]
GVSLERPGVFRGGGRVVDTSSGGKGRRNSFPGGWIWLLWITLIQLNAYNRAIIHNYRSCGAPSAESNG